MTSSPNSPIKVGEHTFKALTEAGYKDAQEILRAPALAIIKVVGRKGYNALVSAFIAEGLLAEDACRWGQVPHRELRILSENTFGELTNSWLATYGQPGSDCCSSPAY